MHDVFPLASRHSILAGDERFEVRIASTREEIRSALRLRFRVFGEELGSTAVNAARIESDLHDPTSQHLIMIERRSGETVGTYRMKSFERAGGVQGFYSNDEFTLDSIPSAILRDGVETGRACIAAEHRNTRAIFLIWKALARYLSLTEKRYFFGCCSIFTKDPTDGLRAFQYLSEKGFVHKSFRVQPRTPICIPDEVDTSGKLFKLPGLFEMYLRIGSRVCGPPTYDAAFGTVDFFVVFDLHEMDEKYRQIFLGD